MSNLKYPRIVGYELVERIGGGGFSTVYKAVNFEQQRVAACKVVACTLETTAQDRKMLDKEIRVHSAMKHVNVLEFLNAVIVEPEAKTKYYPGIYMLLELASGGDLFDKIAPDVGVDEDVAHFYFLQLISGLRYIHGQGVCHRDLKPENLLLDVAGQLKISDFGLCSVFRHKESGRVRMLTERCGSLPYVAPELNSDAPYQAEPVDVWGTGVILFTLLTGNTPWDEPSTASLEFRQYVNGTIFRESPWNRLGEEAISLVRTILNVNPHERATVLDIMSHSWCMKPSQVASESTAVLAQRLTQSLQANGDIDVIDPHSNEQADQDGDVPMSATYQSQFTQSLLLFSQTQSGKRYVPHLTRFYSSLRPSELTRIVVGALQALGVKCKPQPTAPPPLSNDGDDTMDGTDTEATLRVRVGGFDRRKEMFKGWVEVETFMNRGQTGSFCVMQRDQGNPISWRQLWKALVKHPNVEPHVLRRR